MIKKYFVFVFIILGLISCNRSFDNDMWKERIADGYMKEGELLKNYEKIHNLPLDELTKYDFESFYVSNMLRNATDPELSSQSYTLGASYNKYMPIEHIEVIDDDRIYVVYFLEDDNGGETYAYVTFERQIKHLDKNDGVDETGNYELWIRTGEFYFVGKEMLSSSDFDGIVEGTSASAAVAVDASVGYDRYYSFFRADDLVYMFRSYRLLSDGIMIIEFVNTSDEQKEIGNFVVERKTFYPYDSDDVPSEIEIMNNFHPSTD